MRKTISKLQCWLTVLSVACLLISNIITSKQMLLPFDLTITCGIFVFPITYILSDVFSEVYGYKWSRITCYMGFAMNVLMVLIFSLSISTKAPSYWGNQEAFATVLGNTPKVFIASLAAFILGDFVNDIVFKKMKEKKDGLQGFGSRAIISSILGELTDSIIFFPIAFAGEMPFLTLIQAMLVQTTLKVVYEIIILPITKIAVKKVASLEGA